MKTQEVVRKTKSASKLAFIAEVLAKIIAPILYMILARILAPEAFGIVATIGIVTSFTDLFTDAGFQKYLIQQEFRDEKEFYKYTNVAFVTNMILSLIIWLVIGIFNQPIATILGNPGVGLGIIIALSQLPITAISSIQTAIYKRNLDYKPLLISRLVVALTPLFVTVPLALLGFNYWSLIIGTVAGKLFSAIVLTIMSKWKPNTFFDIKILKKMFTKSMLLMAETISKWLCDFFDIFIIGVAISSYYLGLYRVSFQMVNAILTLFTTSIIPVLLSSLSKLTNDDKKFTEVYSFFQKLFAYVLLPLGFGVFFFKELAVTILFGSGWEEACMIVGIIAISLAIKLIFVDVTNTIFIAKDKPKLSVITNIIYLICLIPMAMITVKDGFWKFFYYRNIFVLIYIFVGLFLLKKYKLTKISQMFKNISKPALNTIIMCSFIIMMKSLLPEGIIYDAITIVTSILLYFAVFAIIDNSYLKRFLKFLRKSE